MFIFLHGDISRTTSKICCNTCSNVGLVSLTYKHPKSDSVELPPHLHPHSINGIFEITYHNYKYLQYAYKGCPNN